MKTRTRNRPPDSKQRVLDAACRLFSEKGFQGTHLREICQRARVNIATVCYHFHGKEKLYEAVKEEARLCLLLPPERLSSLTSAPTPERRLCAALRSLLERLGGEGEWVARLAVRESLDQPKVGSGMVGAGLSQHLVLIQLALRQALGPTADQNTVGLTAVTLLSQCVFLSAARTSLPRLFPKRNRTMWSRTNLARHVTRIALRISSDGSASDVEPR